VIAWGSNHKGCEGELAKTGTRFVLGALLVLAAAGTGGSPTSAQDAAHAQDTARTQDNCLAAPTGKTPAGSHWHYRTDPVKQTKCWYLKSDGEAAQAATAADGADAAGGPPRPAAAPPKAAADPANPAAHPRKPHQAARTAAKAEPRGRIRSRKAPTARHSRPPKAVRHGPIRNNRQARPPTLRGQIRRAAAHRLTRQPPARRPRPRPLKTPAT
jgi:hypothetical protein